MGCRSFLFRPGNGEPAGRYTWDIGTAGSATMLALSVLPVLAFRGQWAEAEIQLLQEIGSGATIDRHASDQIIPFASFADGTSRFQVPSSPSTPRPRGGWRHCSSAPRSAPRAGH